MSSIFCVLHTQAARGRHSTTHHPGSPPGACGRPPGRRQPTGRPAGSPPGALWAAHWPPCEAPVVPALSRVILCQTPRHRRQGPGTTPQPFRLRRPQGHAEGNRQPCRSLHVRPCLVRDCTKAFLQVSLLVQMFPVPRNPPRALSCPGFGQCTSCLHPQGFFIARDGSGWCFCLLCAQLRRLQDHLRQHGQPDRVVAAEVGYLLGEAIRRLRASDSAQYIWAPHMGAPPPRPHAPLPVQLPGLQQGEEDASVAVMHVLHLRDRSRSRECTRHVALGSATSVAFGGRARPAPRAPRAWAHDATPGAWTQGMSKHTDFDRTTSTYRK